MWRRTNSHFPFSAVLKSGLSLRTLPVKGPGELAGKSILFFSDTHFRCGATRNLFSGTALHSWNAVAEIADALREACAEIHPDVLIFGGDLVSESVLFPQAFELLKTLSAPLKLAVPGNWDRRRRTWMPFSKIEESFSAAGFRLLMQDSLTWNGIQFTGLDDYKLGFPSADVLKPDPEAAYRIILSHNPDAVVSLPEDKVKGYDLVLSGHTHAGQIRLPFYGALKTSSRYWKFMEYGLYRNGNGPLLALSAGIGATLYGIRFRCPAEILKIEFV